MSDRPDISPEDSAEAAEYALGLLSGSERSAFEARLASDADLRAELAAWQSRFAEIAMSEVEEVTPPARVEKALLDRLFPAPEAQPGWIERFGLARLYGAVFLLAALLLWVVVDLPPRPAYPPENAAYSAQIAAEDGSLVVIAQYDAARGELYLERQEGDARPGRDLELWLIAGEEAPISLGVLNRDQGRERLALAPELETALSDGVLAISDEPRGGSPTGAPTGDVLAVGAVSEV